MKAAPAALRLRGAAAQPAARAAAFWDRLAALRSAPVPGRHAPCG